MNCKFLIITGGVISSLGKGTLISSLGYLFSLRELKIDILKIDPYLNIDAGTMGPQEHGECFVTEDGLECDLDIGNYERVLNKNLKKSNNLTLGKVFKNVLEKERKGDYNGKTVQLIPDVTNEIYNFILEKSKNLDILLIELGGTVGDYESKIFYQALLFLQHKYKNLVFNIHLTTVPYFENIKEFKTKPAQCSFEKLRNKGINPDFVIFRTTKFLPEKIIDKFCKKNLFCRENIFFSKNLENIYLLPLNLKNQNFDIVILNKLGINLNNFNYNQQKLYLFNDFNEKIISHKELKKEYKIGLIVKYKENLDSYKSLLESIKLSSYHLKKKVIIEFIDSEELNEENIKKLDILNGILVPGGFGDRGLNGKILAIKYARENNIPFLGICLGMQLALVEYAKNVLNIKDPNSTEFDKNCDNPIICLIKEIEEKYGIDHNIGGTMNLGSTEIKLVKNSKIEKIYKNEIIFERHRHRYEFNLKYKKIFEDKGLIFSGYNNSSKLIESIELLDKKFFIAVQYHPEYNSKSYKVNQLLFDFIKSIN